MYQSKTLRVATLLLIFLGLFGAAELFAEAPSAAKVGNIVISEDEVQVELQKKLPSVSFHGGIKPEKLEELRKAAREEVITRAYQVNYALANEIAVDSKAVEADWSAFAAKNPGIAKATPAQVDQLKQIRYRELLAKQAVEKAVDSKVTVTDAEVKSYYESNKAQYYQGKLFKASHILVKVDPASNAEEKAKQKEKTEKLMERAKAGEDFFNLAYYESDDRSKYVGGSLGSFHAGQTVPEFDAQIQKMKAGEIAGPVQTLYGYHIIKLDEVKEPRQLPFEEAADMVRERLRKEKREKLYNEWMDTLKQKYPLQGS